MMLVRQSDNGRNPARQHSAPPPALTLLSAHLAETAHHAVDWVRELMGDR